MNMKKLQLIENYILGKLNQNEIDQLWIEFLKDPKLFSYFEIELHLRGIGRQIK